jgi:hypothetical protein
VSDLELRRAVVAEIRLGTAANARADRFHAAQGWTREDLKDNIEVWYRPRRTNRHAGKAA